MQKTKLGVPVNVLGALVFFIGIFSGYQALILLTGYILLFEQDEWLKKACIKAVTLMVFYSLFVMVIDLIPDCINWVSSFIGILGFSISFSKITSIFSLLISALAIVKNLFFIGLGLKALKQQTIKISFVDEFIEKHMA